MHPFRHIRHHSSVALLMLLLAASLHPWSLHGTTSCFGQETPPTATEATPEPTQAPATVEEPAKPNVALGVVNFATDVAPIFAARCLECHGPKEAKEGFRVDERDTLMGFIEPGSVESSSLWTDYLVTKNLESLMPPAKHGGPLSGAELATIQVWIQEGATWPEGATVVAAGAGEGGAKTAPSETPKLDAEASIVSRLWAFQGYLHPATVHFPIALLLVGALFALLAYVPSWTTAEPIARACLALGTLSAVVACAMGWSFATQEGYASWTKVDTDSEIFWHRWSGIIVAATSVVVSAIAFGSKGKHTWRIGLMVTAMMVGLVGHQGGELTYGPELYERAFEQLLGPQAKADTAPAATAPTKEEAAKEDAAKEEAKSI